MLIDTKESALPQMTIGLFSARITLSRVSCPVDSYSRLRLIVCESLMETALTSEVDYAWPHPVA